MDTSKIVIKIASNIMAASHHFTTELKLKSGDVIKTGTRCTDFEWKAGGDNAWVRITIEGREKKLSIPVTALHRYISGFSKPPSIGTMNKWSDDGIARTITGEKTEPDGHGLDGAPSWMLALGYI